MTTYILFLRLSYCLFACRIEKTMHVFSKIWRFAKGYTRELCQPSHSRKLIPVKLNFEGRRSRKFLLAKLCTFKVIHTFNESSFIQAPGYKSAYAWGSLCWRKTTAWKTYWINWVSRWDVSSLILDIPFWVVFLCSLLRNYLSTTCRIDLYES